MTNLTLTIAEIIDLAGFAGLTFHQNHLPEGDDLEAEVVIAECPKDGTKDEETGRRIHTKHIAYMADYPEEGCMPLGPELEAHP